MTRPAVDVADILRVQGQRFLDRYRSSFDFQQLKAFRALLNCRTAALTSMPTPNADFRPSLITRVATGSTPSARPRRANAGWPHGDKSCCRPLTFTWSSPFPRNSTSWSKTTPDSFTISYSPPALPPCWKSRLTPSTRARKLASSAFSTLGARACSLILLLDDRRPL